MSRNKLNKATGFTLLEVILALALAGIIIAVLATSFQQSTTTQRQLAGRVTAAVLGQGKLAELEHGSEAALSGDFLPPYQNYKWSAQEETVGEEMVLITLTLEWRDAYAALHQKVFKGYRRKK